MKKESYYKILSIIILFIVESINFLDEIVVLIRSCLLLLLLLLWIALVMTRKIKKRMIEKHEYETRRGKRKHSADSSSVGVGS